MTRHASAEALALYIEGEVSRWKAARIGAHLAGCDICSQRSAQLTSVPALLAQPGMPPMPDRLAERIQMALTAESADRAARAATDQPGLQARGTVPDVSIPDATARTPGRPDLPERSGRRSRRLRMPDLTAPWLVRGLAAVGAVLLLGGVGYVLANGNSSSQGSLSGISQPAPSAGASRGATSRPTNINNGPSVGVRQLHYERNRQTATFTAYTSNENFTPGNLPQKVRAQVATVKETNLPGATMAPAEGLAQTDKSIGRIPVSQLDGCVSLIASGRQVVLAEVARYLGQPATIVVLQPLAHGSGVFDVVIVALACSRSDGHVITQTTVPTG